MMLLYILIIRLRPSHNMLPYINLTYEEVSQITANEPTLLVTITDIVNQTYTFDNNQ